LQVRRVYDRKDKGLRSQAVCLHE